MAMDKEHYHTQNHKLKDIVEEQEKKIDIFKTKVNYLETKQNRSDKRNIHDEHESDDGGTHGRIDLASLMNDRDDEYNHTNVSDSEEDKFPEVKIKKRGSVPMPKMTKVIRTSKYKRKPEIKKPEVKKRKNNFLSRVKRDPSGNKVNNKYSFRKKPQTPTKNKKSRSPTNTSPPLSYSALKSHEENNSDKIERLKRELQELESEEADDSSDKYNIEFYEDLGNRAPNGKHYGRRHNYSTQMDDRPEKMQD
eukprot:UN23925